MKLCAFLTVDNFQRIKSTSHMNFVILILCKKNAIQIEQLASEQTLAKDSVIENHKQNLKIRK